MKRAFGLAALALVATLLVPVTAFADSTDAASNGVLGDTVPLNTMLVFFATSAAARTVPMTYSLPSCSSGGESMSACSASSIALLYFRCKGTMTRSVGPVIRFREMTQTPRWAVDGFEP